MYTATITAGPSQISDFLTREEMTTTKMADLKQGDQGPGPPDNYPPQKSTNPARLGKTYADKAKMNVRYDQRLKRNVLEIEIVKTDLSEEIDLNQEVLEKLLKNIGIDIISEVEGCQTCYGGKAARVSVLCKAGVAIEKFCRQESFQVSRGVVTRSIRPAGRQDVTVTVSGLHFNTPDSLIQDYITRFGGVLLSKDVIYSRYEEGPFKGKVNGDRKYQVDFSEAKTSMGTFHYLDGERVRVYYRGNMRTCARCHMGGEQCPGGGIAKECQENGGPRKDLFEHMKELWTKIDFSPTTFTLPEHEHDEPEEVSNYGGDQKILSTKDFPRKTVQPALTTPERKKFTKAKITNLPLEISPSDTLEFLKKKVDDKIAVEDIEITKDHRSTQVLLGPGPSQAVIDRALEILDYNKTKTYVYPDRKLYARLHKPLTPEKTTNTSVYSSNLPSETLEKKVMSAVENYENKNEKKKNEKLVKVYGPLSQAKLSGASLDQVVKHKQGVGKKNKY